MKLIISIAIGFTVMALILTIILGGFALAVKLLGIDSEFLMPGFVIGSLLAMGIFVLLITL